MCRNIDGLTIVLEEKEKHFVFGMYLGISSQ